MIELEFYQWVMSKPDNEKPKREGIVVSQFIQERHTTTENFFKVLTPIWDTYTESLIQDWTTFGDLKISLNSPDHWYEYPAWWWMRFKNWSNAPKEGPLRHHKSFTQRTMKW